MIRTYGIATDTTLRPLYSLPPMTLREAEAYRQAYAEIGQTVHVINLKAE